MVQEYIHLAIIYCKRFVFHARKSQGQLARRIPTPKRWPQRRLMKRIPRQLEKMRSRPRQFQKRGAPSDQLALSWLCIGNFGKWIVVSKTVLLAFGFMCRRICRNLCSLPHYYQNHLNFKKVHHHGTMVERSHCKVLLHNTF